MTRDDSPNARPRRVAQLFGFSREEWIAAHVSDGGTETGARRSVDELFGHAARGGSVFLDLTSFLALARLSSEHARRLWALWAPRMGQFRAEIEEAMAEGVVRRTDGERELAIFAEVRRLAQADAP